MCNRQQENQRRYESYVKETNDRIKSNQEAQDKMILAMSVALFGLIPFILEKLQPTCSNKLLIIIFLLCNTFGIIAVMLSFWFCAKGNVEDIKFVEETYQDDKQDSLEKQSIWTKIGAWLNVFSLLFSAISFICFAIILASYFINKEA